MVAMSLKSTRHFDAVRYIEDIEDYVGVGFRHSWDCLTQRYNTNTYVL